MPDDNKKSKDENLSNNSPPAEQAPQAGGDATGGESGSGGGSALSGIVDKAKEFLGIGGGSSGDTGSDAGSDAGGKGKNSADTQKEGKDGGLEGIKNVVEGIKGAVGGGDKAESKQPSLAEQMKELNEVQVDKAFVENSLNLLGTLSFDKLIGNPLRAAIKAQRDLAKETLSYIRDEGIKVDEKGQGQITYVTLSFVRDGKQVKMRVPLLTLMPVPRLSITSMNYTFKAKVDASSAVMASVGSGGTPINTALTMDSSNKSASPALPSSVSGGVQMPATGKADEASKAAKPAEKEAKAVSAPAMTASYSSKKDSGATRDSRYSVETTMDVTITASEGEMPRGIDKLLGVLDDSTEVIDPNGMLRVSADQVSLVNGYAAMSVAYRDGQGSYQPTAVKCAQLNGDKSPVLLESGDDMLLVFSEKGTYKVTAGKLQRIVFVS